MMVGKHNRPTCRLCQAEGARKPPAVRIGVWLCKRHWRLTVALALRARLGDADTRQLTELGNTQELIDTVTYD